VGKNTCSPEPQNKKEKILGKKPLAKKKNGDATE